MNYAAQRRRYRENHRTLGCRISHMLAVPMILVSLILVFFVWERAIVLFASGWLLAFSGHFLFERNQPVVFSDPTNALSYVLGIVFVAEEWAVFLRIRQFADD